MNTMYHCCCHRQNSKRFIFCIILCLLHVVVVSSSSSFLPNSNPNIIQKSSSSPLTDTWNNNSHNKKKKKRHDNNNKRIIETSSSSSIVTSVKDQKQQYIIRHEEGIRSYLNFVSLIAIFNVIFNILRPDDDINWTMRMPRICWELSIAMITKIITIQMKSSISSFTTSTLLILLSFMTLSTGLVDIFIWAPLFATFASFESCINGGPWQFFTNQPKICHNDYTKGIGRLLTSIQSLFGGLLYLMTSVIAFKESFHQHTIHHNYHSNNNNNKNNNNPHYYYDNNNNNNNYYRTISQ